jgi:hypothetical protein
MYLSPIRGDERPVAENEEPLAAGSSGDLIVSRWHSDGSEPDLILRRPDGALAGLIATRVSVSFAEPESRTVLYEHRGGLWRTDGIRTWLVVRVGSLGVRNVEWIDRLEDGQIIVSGRRSIAVLDRDGHTQGHAALARIPRGGAGYVNVLIRDSPMGRVLRTGPLTGGIVLIQAVWRDANAGGGEGWEGVYELLPGASSARLLYGKPLRLAVCAHDSSASWHGRWLLYMACEGRVVAIDSMGQHPSIDLTRTARVIPMPKEERAYGLLGAEWALFGTPAGMPGPGKLDESDPAWMS